jgi:His-Xaa-Ser system protein HxsD
MKNGIIMSLDNEIYELEAVINTCYHFMDKAYVFIDRDNKNKKIIVSLKGKKRLNSNKIKQIEGEFMNELLYSNLRYKINKNNKKITEHIIGRALYSSMSDLSHSLLDSTSAEEKFNYQDDPLGIAIPWEEKYGKNKKNARVKV